MIKISRLADYAVIVLASMSKEQDKVLAAATIAQATHLPEPTVSKVLKTLARQGVVSSVRGVGGGYKLADAPDTLTMADIIMAVDGPISLTACVDKADESCDYACHCPMNGRWDGVNLAIREALEGITLADMMKPACNRNFIKQEVMHEHL